MTIATDSTSSWFLADSAPSEPARQSAAPPSAPPTSRGRTRIVPRALRQVVSAVTAESLGISPHQVGVELGDDHGMLAITISTPIRVAALQRVTREPAVITRTGGTILARSARAQTEIRSRVGELTGADIGRVTVRLTGVDITPERRVR